MRRIALVFILSLAMLTGCISQVVKDKLSKNAAQLDGYVTRMDAEGTTLEEDQDLIRVMRIWTWSMNWAVNGEEPPPDVKLVLEAGSR